MSSPAHSRLFLVAACAALLLSACGSSEPLAALPTPTPTGTDEPQTPVMRCAPHAETQTAKADCVAPQERAS